MYLRFRISIWPLVAVMVIGGTYLILRHFDFTVFTSAGAGSLAGLLLGLLSIIWLVPDNFRKMPRSKKSKFAMLESHAAAAGTFVFATVMLSMPMFLNSILYGIMGLLFFLVLANIARERVNDWSDAYKVNEPAWLSRGTTLMLALAAVFYGDALGYSPVSYSAVAFVFVFLFLIESDKMIRSRYKDA